MKDAVNVSVALPYIYLQFIMKLIEFNNICVKCLQERSEVDGLY